MREKNITIVEANLCSFLLLFVCLFLYCYWRPISQDEKVVIPLTGLNPPHCCACPKPGPGFQLTNGLVCVQWYDVSSYSLSWYWFE